MRLMAAVAVLAGGLAMAAEGQPAEGAPPGQSAPKKEAAAEAPVFPLKSERLAEVCDAIEDQDDLTAVEFGAMEDILLALKASTNDHIAGSVEAAVKFNDMMLKPENYRGHVVQVQGVLRKAEQEKIAPNKADVSSLCHCYVSNASGEIINVLTIEPPPENVRVQNGVRAHGVFLKRFAYVNRKPGEKLTVGPLVIARRIESYSALTGEAGTAPVGPRAGAEHAMARARLWTIVAGTAVGMVVFAYLYQRIKRRQSDQLFPKGKDKDNRKDRKRLFGAKQDFPRKGDE